MTLRLDIVDGIKEIPTMSSTIVKLGQLINLLSAHSKT